MAELATIARRTPKRRSTLAREQNALPVWSQMLRARRVGRRRPARWRAALDNPKLGGAEKESLLLSIARRARSTPTDATSCAC